MRIGSHATCLMESAWHCLACHTNKSAPEGPSAICMVMKHMSEKHHDYRGKVNNLADYSLRSQAVAEALAPWNLGQSIKYAESSPLYSSGQVFRSYFNLIVEEPHNGLIKVCYTRRMHLKGMCTFTEGTFFDVVLKRSL